MIVLENVSKCYSIQSLKRKSLFSYERKQIKALNNISFTVPKGDIVGYVGLNGAGKSTTIKILAGILCPDSGRVMVNGRNPFANKAHCHTIGAVFGQRQQLWDDLPVGDSFQMLKSIYSVSKSDYQERFNLINSFLEIDPLLSMPSRKLSLGQRMKCEFAATLIHWPSVLLLDEPTIGIDLKARKSILDLLYYMNKEQGVTIFLTTHNLNDIETLCQRIVIIDKGGVVYDGSQNRLKEMSKAKKMIAVVTSKEIDRTVFQNIDSSKYKIEFVSSNEICVYYSLQDVEPMLRSIQSVVDKFGIISISTQEVSLEGILTELYEKQ